MSRKNLTLIQVLKRLEELSRLKEGWLTDESGVNGASFENKDFSDIRRFLVDAIDDGLPPPYIYPTEEGGLSIEWDSPHMLFFTANESLQVGYLKGYDSSGKVMIQAHVLFREWDTKIFADTVVRFLKTGDV